MTIYMQYVKKLRQARLNWPYMQYVKLTTVGATTIESVAASTLSEFEEYLMFSLGRIW